MVVALGKINCFIVLVFIFPTPNAVSPDVCFANFRWDDCGQPPQPVMYYWKPGSRCEVGIWRGCLPNPNMFHDEYECINTCIFVARAQPEDYHANLAIDEYTEDTTVDIDVTEFGNLTEANTTQSSNDTEVTTGGDTNVESENATEAVLESETPVTESPEPEETTVPEEPTE